MQTINIAGIVPDSIVDGPGMRVTIFCQGCAHNCEGCHNPQSHPFNAGTDMSIEELFAAVKRNPLCRGVTFSGGEPFAQAEGFLPFAKMLKENNYEIACFTGFTFEQLLNGTLAQQQLLNELDILIDGKFVLEKRNLNLLFRGSENQRILDVKESLAAKAPVWTTQTRWVGAPNP